MRCVTRWSAALTHSHAQANLAACALVAAARGAATAKPKRSPHSHFGFATGTAPKDAPVATTKAAKKRIEKKGELSSPLYDPRKPEAEPGRFARLERFQGKLDRWFNAQAVKDPNMHFLRENLSGLVTYQLVVEQLVTFAFMFFFATGLLTAEAIDDKVKQWLGYDMELATSCKWEDKYILGDAAASENGAMCAYIPGSVLTMWSQGHTLAFYTIWLQIPVILNTYTPVAARLSKSRVAKIYYSMEAYAKKPKSKSPLTKAPTPDRINLR